MSWSGIANNQCVSLDNLRDAIANNIFIAKTAVPAGTKQITKTEALAYVDIQTAPLAGKASNQLVVKNNLNAAVYTYNRYDLNLTTCVTSNPIPVWSYYDIPYGSYTINGTYQYQIIPATHSTFTFQITSYTPYTCTPVTRYTYITNNVNTSTCATFNTIQWWSYNNYASGYYYINGPGTLYLLEGSTHTNYSNQITSAVSSTCGSTPKYSYDMYYVNQCNCQLTYNSQVYSVQSYGTGYYYVLLDNTGDSVYVYLVVSSHTNYTNYIGIPSNGPTCTPDPCLEYVLHNSNPYGFNLNETFTYYNCSGVYTTTTVAPNGYASACVQCGTTPNPGNRGDVPYTLGFTCS